MRPMPLNVSVDKPCDIHFIEAYVMEKDEVTHCKEWDNVPKVVRNGITCMDCPQEKEPRCCATEEEINEKCRLGQYGASLHASPERI